MNERVYEVFPRKDHRGVNLLSDALPFGRLWYAEPNAISQAAPINQTGDARSAAAFLRNFLVNHLISSGKPGAG
jgi:hypothetical protein